MSGCRGGSFRCTNNAIRNRPRALPSRVNTARARFAGRGIAGGSEVPITRANGLLGGCGPSAYTPRPLWSRGNGWLKLSGSSHRGGVMR